MLLVADVADLNVDVLSFLETKNLSVTNPEDAVGDVQHLHVVRR